MARQVALFLLSCLLFPICSPICLLSALLPTTLSTPYLLSHLLYHLLSRVLPAAPSTVLSTAQSSLQHPAALTLRMARADGRADQPPAVRLLPPELRPRHVAATCRPEPESRLLLRRCTLVCWPWPLALSEPLRCAVLIAGLR
eukprot:1165463-Rhodomonas_salina.2